MVDKLTKAKERLNKANDLQDELSSMIYGHLDNIEKLKKEKIDKKAERQTALSYGENVSKITNAINRLDSKIEESEDAIIGLKQRESDVEAEIKSLQKEILYMELEIDKAKLRKVARKYNEKAKELSLIVREFWDLYDHLESERYLDDHYWRFGSGISCDDFENGALSKIPFLRIAGENPRSNLYCNEYLFELYCYRSYERKAPAVSESAEQADDEG